MPSTATTSSSTYSEIKKHFNMTVQIRQLVQCSNKDHKKCSFPIRLMAFYVEYEKREAQSGSMWIWRLVYRIKRGIGTVNHGICRHIHVAYCMALNRSKIVFYLGFFFFILAPRIFPNFLFSPKIFIFPSSHLKLYKLGQKKTPLVCNFVKMREHTGNIL